MGLDITAYKNITLVGKADTFEEYIEKHVYNSCIYAASSFDEYFKGWMEGLTLNGIYRYEDSFGFRAGSYSGYNWWRKWLCQAVLNVSPEAIWNSPEDYTEKPFFRLINFSDCEGIIGPVHSGKLYKDFQEHSKIIEDENYPEGCRKLYTQWMKGFEYASQNGLVEFH